MHKWSPLEHELYRHLESQNFEGLLSGRNLLLAISGGLDSMVMLELLEKLAGASKFQLAIACLHHGPTKDLTLLKYRNDALALVRKIAQIKAIPLFSAESDKELKSESEMRDFRKTTMEKIRLENGFDYSVWAHHQDDFLETQMMRLIRGTGEMGIEPMVFLRGC
jgi:tRNA(Ile)-lysidine synthase TilS/MesJ